MLHFSAVWPTVFGCSVICHLEEMFFILSCVVILRFSPVGMRSALNKPIYTSVLTSLVINVLVLYGDYVRLCACATFCPGVIFRLSYLMKFPLQVSLCIVSELSLMIGAF